MSARHQVAQKLHACTVPGNDRARDLVDLQLLTERENLDLAEVRFVCERLFAYRDAHDWPPVVREQPGWASLYEEAANDLDVAQDVAEAIDRVNEFLERILAAR